MGSLISRPKAPAQPKAQTRVVYVPDPVPVPPAQPAPTEVPAPPPAPTEEETQAGARVQSLLQRNRGIFGTVLTGFKGLLSPREVVPQRKTLLGE